MERTQLNDQEIKENDITSRVHPNLRDTLSAMTPSLQTSNTIASARMRGKAMMEQMTANIPKSDRVTVATKIIPGLLGEPDVTVLIYQPKDMEYGMPGMLSIHGGGMILGSAQGEEPGNARFAEQLGCTVVSPEYRLAPENPFPAGLNDCYATLLWFAENAESLGVNPEKIVVSGGSAGGGLAASVAIKAREDQGPKIAAQFLSYPMLDYRNITSSSYEITDTRVWSRQQNILAWEMYLSNLTHEQIPPLASPALLKDFIGLPPAAIFVGTADVFRDECIEYAQKLMAAGVATELYVYPGVFHGTEGFAPFADISLKMSSHRMDIMQNYFIKGHL